MAQINNNQNNINTSSNNNSNNNNQSNSTILQTASNDNCYQISDEDLDDCDDLNDDLIEGLNGCRGPYERAWTTEATRALIHIRGPMEGSFTEGRQKRTALWLHCTRQLQKLGFRYNAAKVQKKWHNILITYNKNLAKKYVSGYVHWEFFEEMFKYLQGKKANCEMRNNKGEQIRFKLKPNQMQQLQSNRKLDKEEIHGNSANNGKMQAEDAGHTTDDAVLEQGGDSKSNDEFDDDSNSNTDISDIKQPKLEYEHEQLNEQHHQQHQQQQHASQLPLVLPQDTTEFDDDASSNLVNEQDDFEDAFPGDFIGTWWKDYFERKLQVEREKIELQKEMHREQMQINKMSMVQQERMERIKVDAINSLTATLQKLVEVKYRKSTN